MIPFVLVVALAAGIVWADGGHPIPARTGLVGFALAASILSAVVILLRCDPRMGDRARQPGAWIVVIRSLAAGSALVLVFLTGFERLDGELARARIDLARAEAIEDGAPRVAQARVRERRAGRFGDRVELESVRAVDGGRPLPESLTLFLGNRHLEPNASRASRADRLLWPGAWVRIGLRVRPARAPRNPGSPDRDRVAARRGRAARAQLLKPDWVLELAPQASTGSGSLRRFIPSSLAGFWGRRSLERQRVVERLATVGPGQALVRALALGDRSGIPDSLSDAFQRLGLAHLLAVSGLHVGLVAVLAGWLAIWLSGWLGGGLRRAFRVASRTGMRTRLGFGRAPGRSFAWALIFASLAVAGYAGLTGAGISVERATLVFGLFALCQFARRIMAPAVTLAWVALAIGCLDPGALFDRGAQLSFGACAALIAGGFWTTTALRDADPIGGDDLSSAIARTIRETFRASLVVSLGTAPILAFHDLPLPLVSPVVNVVALPCLGMIVLPASLVAAVVAGVGGSPRLLLDAAVWPVGLFVWVVAAAGAALPELPHWTLLPAPWIAGVAWAGLWACRAGRWRVAVVAWLAMSLTSAPLSLSGPFGTESPRAVFFDVGQGDAALVQGRAASLLIDTGPGLPDGSGGMAVVRGLRALGVGRLDVLAVTHGDLDHRGGALRVLESLTVDELWLPVTGRDDETLQSLATRARARGTRVRWLGAGVGDTRRGDLEIDVLWPDPLARGRSRNETSIVLRVVAFGTRFLFTADIGESVERVLVADRSALSADVLKVAHHGSGRSSSASFLESVAPRLVVVSAPCDATRGLPNAVVLERLRGLGSVLGWTGRDGAIQVRRAESSGGLEVETWGQPRRCGT